MPNSESFDAFYSRTVWNVTSQLHALAPGDNAADHAIREAYGQAYRQWSEISGYPDTEGWVLAAARQAYQRRRPEAAARLSAGAPGQAGSARPGPPEPADEPGARPAAEWPGSAAAADSAAGQNGLPQGPAIDMLTWGTDDDGSARPGAGLATAPVPAGWPPPDLPGEETAGDGGPGSLRFGFGRRRVLIGLVAAAVLVVAAGAGYLVASQTGRAAAAARGSTAPSAGKAAAQMLGAGQTGSRAAIPWSLVGPGWTLVAVSAQRPTATGVAGGGGAVSMYLADPRGGRYLIQATTGQTRLLAWSGNARNALVAVPAGASGSDVSYALLSLTTGAVSTLPLPPGVTAVGFTRPDGLNILAVRQDKAAFRLERFNLQGAYQATLGSLPRRKGVRAWQVGCVISCGALSSPDGITAVWGVRGDPMQLVSNTGGLIRKLTVPGSGSPSSCVPVTWWTANTVLADCAVRGKPYPAGRLWLVPATGATPTPVTRPSGSAAGLGVEAGAWQAAGSVYVTSTSRAACRGAGPGPRGLAIRRVAVSGAEHRIGIGDTTGNHAAVVSAVGNRLLVLAQTSCPGSSSLLWINPATGATQTVLAAPAGQVGVVAAVPYGNGPTATADGL